MSYFPSDIPFMSHDELIENGIHIPKDMSKELKPCPFCGSKNVVLENKNGGYQVRCRFCGARGKYTVVGLHGSRMEAINAWNRRSDDV